MMNMVGMIGVIIVTILLSIIVGFAGICMYGARSCFKDYRKTREWEYLGMGSMMLMIGILLILLLVAIFFSN